MYLTHDANASTVVAARAFGGAGSQLAFTYLASPVHRTLAQQLGPYLSPARWAFWALAARAGEFFRHSFETATLPSWLEAKGWRLVFDKGCVDVADEVGVPRELARRFALNSSSFATGGVEHRYALAALAPPSAADQ
jgi:hypothetical protein